MQTSPRIRPATIQEEFWGGEFGDRYLRRNRVVWQKRVPFWRDMLANTEARSVLEVGCNFGANLLALREVDPLLSTWGIDVNEAALEQARRSGLAVVKRSASQAHTCGRFDLVATVGVLIHVPTTQLPEVMDSIIKASRRYVLAVEYAADEEKEIVYRGHTGYLWKRPFGNLYAAKGLTLVDEGEAPADGFDRCKWWLLRI